MKFIDIVRNLFIGGVHFYRKHPDMGKIANDLIILNSNQDLKKSNETIILLINSLNLSFVHDLILMALFV